MQPIHQRPSPNFDERAGAPIDILLLHYTGMPTGAEALDRLCDAEAKVSAHYFVDEEGVITQMVEESQRAWHAGLSYWEGETNINARSIGIEIVNPGHEWGYTNFPEKQMDAVMGLSQRILSRHAIPAHRVLGHSDVAPERKEDPGEKFPWKRLAEEGVGLWVDSDSSQPCDAFYDIVALRDGLCAFGYDAAGKAEVDDKLLRIITAFQRHYAPHRLGDAFDQAQWQILSALNVAKARSAIT